jgi:hypothetical protein
MPVVDVDGEKERLGGAEGAGGAEAGRPGGAEGTAEIATSIEFEIGRIYSPLAESLGISTI